jgi:hypothetical protein
VLLTNCPLIPKRFSVAAHVGFIAGRATHCYESSLFLFSTCDWTGEENRPLSGLRSLGIFLERMRSAQRPVSIVVWSYFSEQLVRLFSEGSVLDYNCVSFIKLPTQLETIKDVISHAQNNIAIPQQRSVRDTTNLYHELSKCVRSEKHRTVNAFYTFSHVLNEIISNDQDKLIMHAKMVKNFLQGRDGGQGVGVIAEEATEKIEKEVERLMIRQELKENIFYLDLKLSLQTLENSTNLLSSALGSSLDLRPIAGRVIECYERVKTAFIAFTEYLEKR